MRIKNISFIYILLLLFTRSFGQSDIRFNHLTIEDGLPNNIINCMLQDKSGFIWIGTKDGLCRFDGNSITTFKHKKGDTTTLSGNQVNCIYQDTCNNIWVGTNLGLSKYNSVTRIFDNYYFDKVEAGNDANLVSNIIQDKNGSIWAATGTGIYSSSSINPHFLPLKVFHGAHYGFLIHGIANTSGGRIFILKDTALFYSDDCGHSFKTALTYTINGRKPFSELYYDKSDETLWFGMYGNSLAWRFNTKNFELKSYCLEPQAITHYNSAPYAFCRLNDSVMLVGCLFGLGKTEGNLTFLNTKTGICENYLHDFENPFSLSSGNIYTIFKDCQGTFWFGTDQGINSFNLQQLHFHWLSSKNINLSKLDGFSITQVCYNGKLWMALLGQGLVEFDPANNHSVLYPLSINSSRDSHRDKIFSIYAANSILWLGVAHGIIRFDINTHRLDTLKLPVPELKQIYSTTVRNIGRDNAGIYWFATYQDGVFSYNPSTGKGAHFLSKDTDVTPKHKNHIRCMAIDAKGNKWIGTYEDGFCRIESGTNEISWNEQGDNDATIMQRGWINDIYCDSDGNTYLATEDDGLILYEESTKTFRTIKNNKWPEDNRINKIVVSQNRILWLATCKGLSNWDLKNNTFRNYPGGKQLANIINVVGCTSQDGNIYLGGGDQLLYFNSNTVKETSPQIHPEVTGVTIVNKEHQLDSTRSLFLSYRDNYISFTFSAFDFLNEQGDQFAYYLEGFDEVWNYCQNRHYATYTNLPGGNYTLRVKAQNAEGLWIETTHPIRIHITTPYYKTWWFFVLCGLALFGLGYLFYYLQVQRLLEAERLRIRLARDLHDDVGSSLSSISIISSMAKKKQDHEPEEVKKLFTTISETSQKTLDSISDLVWTLNPENDQMEDLFTRMRVYISEILEAKEIGYEFNVGEEVGQLKIAMDKRKNLYLIFKEAINNIAKYSECNKATIALNLNNENIIMEISDDGKGFVTESAEQSGNGMKNMKHRSSQLSGTLAIQSNPGKGVYLKLVFPYT